LSVSHCSCSRIGGTRIRERSKPHPLGHLPRSYWLYLAAGALIGFGFVDFSLIAFHFQKTGTLGDSAISVSSIPVSVPWLVGSVAFGLLYEKSLPTLVVVSVVGQLLSLPLFVVGRRATQTNK